MLKSACDRMMCSHLSPKRVQESPSEPRRAAGSPREPYSRVRMAKFSEKNIEKKAMCAVMRMAIFIVQINHEIGSCAMVLDAVFHGVDGHVHCKI